MYQAMHAMHGSAQQEAFRCNQIHWKIWHIDAACFVRLTFDFTHMSWFQECLSRMKEATMVFL